MAVRTRRVALAVIGALVTLGPVAIAPSASPAAATASSGACTSSTGITVVVDMTAFGDGVHVRCAPQPVSSGYEALTKAGFTIQGTAQFPGLLCRIDGRPTPAEDACQKAPPADAYWAYWHAPRGGSWTYSTSGAGSRKPPPGSVEGWAFGDEAVPGVDPPDPPPSTTTTRPSSTPTTSVAGRGAGAAPPPSLGSIGGTTTTAASGGGDRSSTTTASPASDSTTSTTDTSTAVIDGTDGGAGGSGESASTASSSGADDSGSPLGLLVGVIVAGALTAAGVVMARRRRPPEEGLA